MTHPRKIIRSAIADALRLANTGAADRVYEGEEPAIPIEDVLKEEGPVIVVYTRRDRADDRDYPASGLGSVKRRCDLMIEVLAAGRHAVDDKVDELAEQVETVLNDFKVPGMPAAEIRHEETNTVVSTVGELPVGGGFLQYDACYWKEWRKEPDEDEWFPEIVLSSPKGETPGQVATCADCTDGECPH